MDDGFYSKNDKRDVSNARPVLLLHPNIPKPLHGLAPRELLGREWWDRERKAAYKRSHYTCAACGVPKEEARYHQWLEAHEIYDINYPLGRSVFIETVALCHSCHNFIHSGRMQILRDKNDPSMPRKKFLDIIHRGNALLVKAGLRKNPYIGKSAPWHKWRLVINGTEYKPKFKSFKSWAKHYGHEIKKEKEEDYSDFDEDWVPPDLEMY